jgi:hypothetical protein
MKNARCTLLIVMSNRSFANVSQAILLTAVVEEGFPKFFENGLKQGFMEPSCSFISGLRTLTGARRQLHTQALRMLHCRALNCLTSRCSNSLLCFFLLSYSLLHQ